MSGNKVENQLPEFVSTQALLGNPQAAYNQNHITPSTAFQQDSSANVKDRNENVIAGWDRRDDMSQGNSEDGQASTRSGMETDGPLRSMQMRGQPPEDEVDSIIGAPSRSIIPYDHT